MGDCWMLSFCLVYVHKKICNPFLSKAFSIFWEKVSCSLGWSWYHISSDDVPTLPILLPLPPSTEVTGVPLGALGILTLQRYHKLQTQTLPPLARWAYLLQWECAAFPQKAVWREITGLSTNEQTVIQMQNFHLRKWYPCHLSTALQTSYASWNAFLLSWSPTSAILQPWFRASCEVMWLNMKVVSNLAKVKGPWAWNDQKLIQKQICNEPKVSLVVLARVTSHDSKHTPCALCTVRIVKPHDATEGFLTCETAV